MRINGPLILLSSGNYFSYKDIKSNKYLIEDIAHGLSHVCRFAGHTERFYSVAEHCYHASYVIEDQQFALDALMHDASEAYLGDIPRPLKALLPEYVEIEKQVEAEIAKEFNLTYPMSEAVKLVDIRLLATEKQLVMNFLNNTDSWEYLDGVAELPLRLLCWSPKVSKEKFLDRYYELVQQ